MSVTTTVPWACVKDRRCPFIYMMGTYPPLIAMALVFGEEVLGVFTTELFIECGCKDFRDGVWSLMLRDVFADQEKNLHNMGLDHAITQEAKQSNISTVISDCPSCILDMRLKFMELESFLISTLRGGIVIYQYSVISLVFLIIKSTWRAPCL